MVNNILYLNDPMPRIEIQKENKSQNILRKQYASKQSTEPYEYKIAKVILRPWAEKINASLTQKDTMDRGAWIKNSERRHAGGLRKDKKSKSTKVKNGMGMRNKPTFLFTICYNPVVSNLGATRRQR